MAEIKAKGLEQRRKEALEQGLKLIDKNHKEFELYVQDQFDEQRQGWYVSYFFDVATAIKAGKFDEAYDLVHTPGFPTKSMVAACDLFLKQGTAFIKYILQRNRQYEMHAKEEKLQSFFPTNVADFLMDCRRKGENIFVVYNGKKLYSMTQEMDDWYMLMVGEKKADYDRALQEDREKAEKEEKESIAKIPARVERGLDLIDINQEEWETYVDKKSKGLYLGTQIDIALDVLEAMKEEGVEKAYQIMKKNDAIGGSGYHAVMGVLSKFSSHAKEINDYIIEMSTENDNS